MVPETAITLPVAFFTILASAPTINKRIIGGEDAKEGEFPFIVSVSSSGGECGGSLLDNTTVLTAAHCIKRSAPCISVRAGSLNRDTGGIVVNVASFTKHPNYVPRKEERRPLNDIAILKLSTPIEQSETISFATLSASHTNSGANSEAVVAGWAEGNILRKVTVPIHAPEDCSKDTELELGAMSGLICAGEEGKDADHGDSGGPLIDESTGQLIGIVSTYYTRGDSTAGLYTKVDNYIPFINERLGATSSGPNPDSANHVELELLCKTEQETETKETIRKLEDRLESACPRDSNGQRSQSCSEQIKDCDTKASENNEAQTAVDKLWHLVNCVDIAQKEERYRQEQLIHENIH